MLDQAKNKPHSFGISAMLIATLALFISVAHLTIGPFETQKPVEQTIAETAVKIKEAAKRAVTGEPAPQVVAQESRFDLDTITTFFALACAAAAMLLAIIALVRREERSLAFIGFSLGTGVLLMAWLQWIALLICGAILLVAIINNLGDILPS